MDGPLLSILIPTKNRYKTLFPVVKALINGLSDQDYEILIQDNTFDNLEMIEYLNSINNNHVSYFHNTHNLSMVDNSELAISNAKGKFLCFIGDDDIVNPIILDIVKYCDQFNVESLTFPIGNYFYPDVRFKKVYGFNKPGAFSFTQDNSFNFHAVDSFSELNRVLEGGGIFILDLPRLYHGIVKKSIMELVKSKYGKYVPGPCPDMTTSVALATVIKTYYKMNITLTVSGNSFISEGGKGPTNGHVVKLEDKSWLNQEDIRDWNSQIPKIFSRETIWAQSVYHVLSLTTAPKLNFIPLYNSMIFTGPSHILKYVNPLYFSQNLFSLKLYISFFLSYTKRWIRQILFFLPSWCLETVMRLRGDFKSTILVENVSRIDDCMNVLAKSNEKIPDFLSVINNKINR